MTPTLLSIAAVLNLALIMTMNSLLAKSYDKLKDARNKIEELEQKLAELNRYECREHRRADDADRDCCEGCWI